MSVIDIENATEFDEVTVISLCSITDNVDISWMERVLLNQLTFLLTKMNEPEIFREPLDERWLDFVRLSSSIVDKILIVAYSNGCYLGMFRPIIIVFAHVKYIRFSSVSTFSVNSSLASSPNFTQAI